MPANQLPGILSIVIEVASLLAIFVAVLYLYRGYSRLAQRALANCYAGFAVHQEPQPGDVIVTYHTYHGVILWVTLTTHRVAIPAAQARMLLGRLLRFNLWWSLLAFGSPVLLALSILNYLTTRGSIADQEAAPTLDRDDMPPMSSATEAQLSNPYAPPRMSVPASASGNLGTGFQKLLGWVCAAMAVLFGMGMVVSFISGETERAIGGLIPILLFGWFAWDWIGKRRG